MFCLKDYILAQNTENLESNCHGNGSNLMVKMVNCNVKQMYKCTQKTQIKTIKSTYTSFVRPAWFPESSTLLLAMSVC